MAELLLKDRRCLKTFLLLCSNTSGQYVKRQLTAMKWPEPQLRELMGAGLGLLCYCNRTCSKPLSWVYSSTK